MKTTRHRIHYQDARTMTRLPDASVEMVLTSPPYPMIQMWDEVFDRLEPGIGGCIQAGLGLEAFHRMHRVLDPVWQECFRVVKPGGIVCINVGDAVRTLEGRFALYPNHARVLDACLAAGLTPLPLILWRKQTNAPNKFMGSGTLPAGAYVTLEHEYVLVFRKGAKRDFSVEPERSLRRESAIFWEERNTWFSDVWTDLKGAGQDLSVAGVRRRSGAFPFELAYRLIQMFSIKGDTVLDPFAGTGTTLFAAMASARQSIGIELEEGLQTVLLTGLGNAKTAANRRMADRLQDHLQFVQDRFPEPALALHVNRHYGFPVVTGQETDLVLSPVRRIRRTADGCFEADYLDAAVMDPAAFEQPTLF